MYDTRGGPHAGAANWSSGFLPATTQGSVFRATGDPILDIRPPDEIPPERQRSRLDFLAWLNQKHVDKHPGSDELAARIASYELAYRMQSCAPQAVDLTSEGDATKSLYGLDAEITEPFGKQCLLARRLVERGVRFVQLYSGSTAANGWDAHDNLKQNHSLKRPAGRQAHRRSHSRPEAARTAGRNSRHLAHRVRAHAHFTTRSWPGPQPPRYVDLDGGRGYPRWTGYRRDRRVGLRGRRASGDEP